MYYFNGSEQTFTWLGRQLQSVTNGNGSFTFEYNADGIRTAKYRNNNIFAQYFLDGDRIVGERRANEMYIYIYDASGSPIGFQYRKDTYAADVWDSFWYEKNVQGDIVAVYNDAGVKLVSYVYNAWGAFSESYSNGGVSTAAYKNPFLYRGYYYDRDINFYYLNSRYYDFKTGRFINADEFSLLKISATQLTDKNLYAYCDNNPVTRKDENGDFWLAALIVSVVVSVVAEYVSDFVEDLVKGESFGEAVKWDLSVGETVGAAVGGAISAIPGGGIVASLAGNFASAAVESVEDIITDNSDEINKNAFSAVESTLIDIPESKTVDKFEGFIKSFLPDGTDPFKTTKQIKIFGKAKAFSSKTPWGLAIESVVKIGRGVFDGVFYVD